MMGKSWCRKIQRQRQLILHLSASTRRQPRHDVCKTNVPMEPLPKVMGSCTEGSDDVANQAQFPTPGVKARGVRDHCAAGDDNFENAASGNFFCL